MPTIDKSSIVSAIKELNSNLTDITKESIFVGSKETSGVNKWFKVCNQTCSGYGNTNIMFAVTRGFATMSEKGQGILSIQIRSNDTFIQINDFVWLANSGLTPSDFVIVISGMSWALYARNTARHNFIKFEALSRGNMMESKYTWPLNYTSPNTTPEATAPTPTAISEAVSIPAANVPVSAISGMTATTTQAALSELNANTLKTIATDGTTTKLKISLPTIDANKNKVLNVFLFSNKGTIRIFMRYNGADVNTLEANYAVLDGSCEVTPTSDGYEIECGTFVRWYYMLGTTSTNYQVSLV